MPTLKSQCFKLYKEVEGTGAAENLQIFFFGLRQTSEDLKKVILRRRRLPLARKSKIRAQGSKIIAEPVAAMAAGGPAAGGRRQASSLGRANAGPSLERNPSNPFQKPLEVQ